MPVKISDLTDKPVLTGAEQLEINDAGTSKRATAQAIADLAPAGTGIVETIVAGANVTVDATDPANPIVSATGSGGLTRGQVADALNVPTFL
jgi:hypothetical protein